MPNRALALALAALVASTAGASSAARNPNDPGHWRRRAHAPPLPYPYAVHPQTPGALPRLRLDRRHGSPVTPYPGALYPTSPAPLPQGFTMTVEREVGDQARGASREPGSPPPPAQSARDGDAPLNLPREIADRIGACWRPSVPPGQSYEITLRMSFNASGAVIGAPQIAYVKAGPRADDQDELRASILDAIKACAPLRFTPGLASAIAGRLFAIRFIARNRVPPDSQAP